MKKLDSTHGAQTSTSVDHTYRTTVS